MWLKMRDRVYFFFFYLLLINGFFGSVLTRPIDSIVLPSQICAHIYWGLRTYVCPCQWMKFYLYICLFSFRCSTFDYFYYFLILRISLISISIKSVLINCREASLCVSAFQHLITIANTFYYCLILLFTAC